MAVINRVEEEEEEEEETKPVASFVFHLVHELIFFVFSISQPQLEQFHHNVHTSEESRTIKSLLCYSNKMSKAAVIHILVNVWNDKMKTEWNCAGAAAHELSAESAALLVFTELYSDYSSLIIDLLSALSLCRFQRNSSQTVRDSLVNNTTRSAAEEMNIYIRRWWRPKTELKERRPDKHDSTWRIMSVTAGCGTKQPYINIKGSLFSQWPIISVIVVKKQKTDQNQ